MSDRKKECSQRKGKSEEGSKKEVNEGKYELKKEVKRKQKGNKEIKVIKQVKKRISWKAKKGNTKKVKKEVRKYKVFCEVICSRFNVNIYFEL